MPTEPLAEPIYLSSVYQCRDPRQADALLGGAEPGFVYSRDGHPNAASLAEKCRELHGAERAAIAGSGMGALALAVLSQLKQGDHVVVSRQLYGRSLVLLVDELARLGVDATLVDSCDLDAVRSAVIERTGMIVVETISNPTLRVANLPALAQIAHDGGALLLVDNTLASPIVCRPIEHGADLVLESLTKIMSGHSDVVLGLLCGGAAHWERVPGALSSWGLASSPFDCYLAQRGLATLALRARQAGDNALAAARRLAERSEVETVHYPGLESHADHSLAARQFGGRFGAMISLVLKGGRASADRFIAAGAIPFCPSLGELSTTLSHPATTSHRNLNAEQQAALGISGGMIRLSIGVESTAGVIESIERSLAAVG
jgi:cystathionine beta-lyase/cystathionine gamma-synthase